MCIRDSLGDGLAYQVFEGIACRRAQQLGRRVLIRRQSRDCLLYTSDAADERSSVDLGGRRIIKKKNNRVRVR